MKIRLASQQDAAEIAAVKVRTWQSTYAGIIPANFLAALSVAENTQNIDRMIARPGPGSFVLVAEDDGGRIIGFAMAGPDRSANPLYAGEVYAIYVLPAQQQRGTGRQLIAGCCRSLLETGITSLEIWVLAQNPARKFYEVLGGQFLQEDFIDIGSARLKIVAYGWPDIHSLAGSNNRG